MQKIKYYKQVWLILDMHEYLKVNHYNLSHWEINDETQGSGELIEEVLYRIW